MNNTYQSAFFGVDASQTEFVMNLSMTTNCKNNAIIYYIVKIYIYCSRAVVLFCIGISMIYCFCLYCGLLIYARFYDCDPLQTKVGLAVLFTFTEIIARGFESLKVQTFVR